MYDNFTLPKTKCYMMNDVAYRWRHHALYVVDWLAFPCCELLHEELSLLKYDFLERLFTDPEISHRLQSKTAQPSPFIPITPHNPYNSLKIMTCMAVHYSSMSSYAVIVLCCLVYIYSIHVWFSGHENFIIRPRKPSMRCIVSMLDNEE